MIDYKTIFEKTAGCYLILQANYPIFTILAVSDAYNEATFTKREEIVGKMLFEVFPDNPDDKLSKGVDNLTKSLTWVIENKMKHKMPTQKYDVVNPVTGKFQEKYWSPENTPVLSPSAEIQYIIHSAKDVTELVRFQKEAERSKNLLIEAVKLNDLYYEKLKNM